MCVIYAVINQPLCALSKTLQWGTALLKPQFLIRGVRRSHKNLQIGTMVAENTLVITMQLKRRFRGCVSVAEIISMALFIEKYYFVEWRNDWLCWLIVSTSYWCVKLLPRAHRTASRACIQAHCVYNAYASPIPAIHYQQNTHNANERYGHEINHGVYDCLHLVSIPLFNIGEP